MMRLLVLREQIKKIYARYGSHIIRILRFLLALGAFLAINGSVGYMARLNQIWLAAGLAVVCGFLPGGAVTVVAAVYVLAHLYAVSLEVLLVVLAIFILFFCLYYVFQPGDSLLLLIMPLMFVCRIPLIVPLVLGLTGTAFSVIPMSFGVMIYYMLNFIHENVGVLSSSGSLSMPGRYTQMIDGILGNREMWVVMAAFCLTLLLVYAVRRLSVNHAWKIAVLAGTLANIVFLFVGVFAVDISLSIPAVVIGAVLAAVIGLALEFFLFPLDYSRTEQVQFEDDDYYYYVKAVPKVAVTQPEVTVTKINPKPQGDGGEEIFTLRQDTGSTADVFEARKDLEETKVLFQKGKKKDLEETQALDDITQPLGEAEEIRGSDYDETV